MNNKIIIISIVALIVGLVGGYAGSSIPSNAPQLKGETGEESVSITPDASDFLSLRPEISSLPTQDISDGERDGLILMREEEKLAHDVYTALYEIWGHKVFSNIAQSEQTHIEAIRTLLIKYGILDPVTDESVGAFTNQDLAGLYTTLVAQGQTSLKDALNVGALIEDLDIADLERLAAETDNEDITLVYSNLTRGSRNHIRSFISQIEMQGGVYTPQYITEQEFNDIISSPREIGAQGGGGMNGSRRGTGGR